MAFLSATFFHVALLNSVLLAGGDAASSYNAAYAQAREAGQPLVVLIGADWCPGCRTMKQSIMPQLAADGTLKTVAYAQVNTDQEGALARKMMSGSSIPQLVMYYETENGWQRKQITGASPTSEVTRFIQQGVSESAAFVAQTQKTRKDEVAQKTPSPTVSN